MSQRRGNSPWQGLPRGREGQHARRKRDPEQVPRPPAMCMFQKDLAEQLVDEEPAPVFGQYPRGYIERMLVWMQARRQDILHVCSGALPPGEGIRVDLRPEAAPDILADGRSLPLPDDSQAAVMLDPPYSEHYAKQLYGTEYPTPASLLREAVRVVRPSGRIAIVHFIVPAAPAGARVVKVFGLSTGANMTMRAVTIFEKEQGSLL